MKRNRTAGAFLSMMVLAVALGSGCAPVEQTPATTAAEMAAERAETNKQIVRDFIARINARDLDSLDELVAPDVVRTSPSTPGLEVTNLEQFKAFLRQDFASVPDSVQEIRAMVAEGDLVAVWANYSGTQSGQMGPFPPSGGEVDLDFAGVLRIEDGKIVEIWAVWDNLSMLSQLGHLPAPGPPQE